MFALLLAAAVIYLMLGDLTEAVVLAIFASTSVLIAVVQEARTERVLESLRDLTSPRALVIRDGTEKRIAGAEVVRGDLIIPPRATAYRLTRPLCWRTSSSATRRC
jgi:P-type Ca2+ transporter type 2C